MGSRRKARECALQILFQLEFSPDRLEEMLQDYWAAQPVKPEIKEKEIKKWKRFMKLNWKR